MRKKKIINNAILTIGAFLVVLIASLHNIGHDSFITRGQPDSYSIVFNATKNRLTPNTANPDGHSGNANAVTELGNNVAFDYSGLTSPAGMWQTIKASGYITNTAPVSGMMTLNIEKADASAHVRVFWSNDQTFDASRSI